MEPETQFKCRPPPKTYLESLRRSQEPLPFGAGYTTPTDDEWANILSKRRQMREDPKAYLRASEAGLEVNYAYLEMSDRARPPTPFDTLLTDKMYGLLNLYWSMKKSGMEPSQLGSAVRQNKMHRDNINDMRDWATDNLKQVVLGPDVHYRDFLFEVLDDLNEISAISFSGASMDQCFLLQMPKEIRDNIFKRVFDRACCRNFTPAVCSEEFNIEENIPRDPTTGASKNGKLIRYTKKTVMAVLYVSKSIYAYALPMYYASMDFNFVCTCTMAICFTRASAFVLSNIRNVELVWKGGNREKAFAKLAELPNLEKLTIVLHKATKDVLSAKEKTIRDFFERQRPASAQFTNIFDTAGFDELVKVRGLKEFQLIGPKKVLKNLRCKKEAENLDKFLKHTMCQKSDVPPGESGWSTIPPKKAKNVHLHLQGGAGALEADHAGQADEGN